MDHLLTEARNPSSANLDELSALEIVRLMTGEDAKIVPAVAAESAAIAHAIDAITERIASGGRLVYIGAGTSGRLGILDASECPPTFRTPPGLVIGIIAGGHPALTTAIEGAEDRPELAERDMQAIHFSAKDAIVGIATSGRTPYVVGGLRYARSLGAYTIGLSCVTGSDLSVYADVMISPLVGPEILTGSTRLKAGTATKLVLNMLSTGAMVRSGKTFGNLMVDLRATNSKLRARANRIVRQFTGLPHDHAEELLKDCDWEVKTALVAHRVQVDAATARSLLTAAGGHVRAALSAPEPESRLPPALRNGSSTLVLGVDGGGTHTTALLAEVSADSPDRWKVLGRGQGGPSNMQAVGIEQAMEALEEAIGSAFRAARRPRMPVAAACLGLAGAGRDDDQARVRRWADEMHLAERIEVTGDTNLLLDAATAEGWGVALIAGTGSAVWAKAQDGRTARAGGWGPLLGDEGSGYALVLAALRGVAAATDGRGGPTALTDALLPRMSITDPQGIIAALHGGEWDRARLAALAPVVFDSAKRGDPVARGIVLNAAGELADMIRAACRQLEMQSSTFPLALTGGVLLASDEYRRCVLEAVAERKLKPDPVCLVAEPAEGAIRKALRMLHARGAQKA